MTINISLSAADLKALEAGTGVDIKLVPAAPVPAPKPPVASPEGTVISGTNGHLTNSGGIQLAINSGQQLTLNGAVEPSSSGVIKIAISKDQFYQLNTSNAVWTQPASGGPGVLVTDAAILALFTGATPAPKPVPTPTPTPAPHGNFATPTFRDSFTSIDPSVWVPHYLSEPLYSLTGNKEAEYYTPDAIGTGPSGLTLTATRRASPMDYQGSSLTWDSGMLCSVRAPQSLGYREFVMQLPKEKGMWPAAWFLFEGGANAAGAWGEMDLIETVGDPTELFMTAHSQDNIAINWPWPMTVQDLSVGFHKFGWLWTKDTCTWFLDDEEKTHMPTPSDFTKGYPIINLAVGGSGSWPAQTHGEPDASVSSAVLRVKRYSEYALGSWGSSQIPTTEPV